MPLLREFLFRLCYSLSRILQNHKLHPIKVFDKNSSDKNIRRTKFGLVMKILSENFLSNKIFHSRKAVNISVTKEGKRSKVSFSKGRKMKMINLLQIS